MKRILYILCQWIWGLPQNLVGSLFYLYYRAKGCPHFSYQGAVVTVWTRRSGHRSLGRYLFMHPTWTPRNHALLAHEYGHTIQSLFFGPLYLLTVGLPSLVWAGTPALQRRRRERHISYYSVYPEKSASALGERFAKARLPEELELRV